MNKKHQIISNDSKISSSIGNSWIICKSKSYPGRVYYFNTISGEAAWNLSVAEMEKAQKTTLNSEYNIKHIDFPEPLETPQDIIYNLNPNIKKKSVQHSSVPPRIYNKQIINNKFSRPTNEISNPPYTFSAINTMNPLNYSLPAFPSLMNVPSNSIILAPPMNTLQQNVDNNYNPMINNQTFISTSIPMSNSQNMMTTRSPFHLNTNVNREILQTNNIPKKTVDLRQKLLNIRNKSHNITGTGERSSNLFEQSTHDVIDTSQENHLNGINEPVLADDLTEELIQDLDVQALKKEFGITTANVWYLVADEDVFLGYRNFIIKLLESDDQCRLVIPQVVIFQIQKSTTSINNKESLHAACFISEALGSNAAIIDEDDNFDSDNHYESIFNCCLKLVNQNCAMVFVSVKDMHNNDCGFPMFTIREVKKILMNAKIKDGLSITITIPNVCDEENALNNSVLNKLMDCNIDDTFGENHTDIKVSPSTKDISIQTEDLYKKVDIAIQVDFCVPDDKNINQSNKNIRGKSIQLRRKPLSRSCTASNTSNISDSMNSVPKVRVQDAATNTDIESDRNVMFHILNKTMEDYLRVKSDEWVSRFVQIMEEAMSQILQQDSSFVLDMPPPWTIYEASECIKRKFSYDSDILDAATKLSDVLFENGGLRGKINNNIDPNSYMKMYSYGYYLIDALQGLIANNEDLQIAGTSLTKLLNDIQNAHLEPSNSDSFTDIDSSPHIDIEIYTNKFLRNDQTSSSLLKDVVTISDSLSGGNNVIQVDSFNNINTNFMTKENPKTKSKVQEDHMKVSPTKPTKLFENNVTIKSITQESPTKRTNLRKNIQAQISEKQGANEIILKHLSTKDSFLTNFELKSINSSVVEDSNDSALLNATKGHTFDTKQSDGPKIMRNFTVCPEFEKRLHKQSVKLTDDIEQKLDYECMDESVASEAEDLEENETEIDPIPLGLEDQEHLKQSESFKHFLDEVGMKVKKSFLTVYSFCENSRNILLGSPDDNKKLEIRTKAIKMGEFLDNMCLSLKRISDRESDNSQKGTRDILFQIGIRDEDIDEKELEYYRSYVSRCMVQGDILQRSLKLLIKAIGET